MPYLEQFDNVYLWKRRLRLAPSASFSNDEIHLYVCWNGRERPSTAILKDKLLYGIFAMKTGLCYGVSNAEPPGAFGGSTFTMSKVIGDKKAALEEYKRRVKNFPRSKEIDYGFPVDEVVPSDEAVVDNGANESTT